MTDEMMSEFIAEATDHLTRAEEILLTFSGQPEQNDAEAINACFRSIHTIKGCSGFLDLPRTQHLSHAAEQILDALRTNALQGSAAVFDALLFSVTRLQGHVEVLNGQSPSIPETDDDCLQQLEALRQKPGETANKPLDKADPNTDTNNTGPLAAISTAIAEIIVCGPEDAGGIIKIIEELSQCMLSGPWDPDARPVMTRIRQLLDGLSGPGAQEAFQNLIKQLGQLETLQHNALNLGEQKNHENNATRAALSPMPSDQSSDALGEFISEANELLTQAEATVVGKSTFTSEEVNSVFRAFHTVKGMAAYLAQPSIERLAHQFEAQIQPVRDGEERADEGFAANVLIGVDALRMAVVEIKKQLVGAPAGNQPTGAEQQNELSLGKDSVSTIKSGSGERIGDLLADLGVSRKAIELNAVDLKAGERLGDKLVEQGAATRQQVEKAAQVQQAIKTTGDVFSRVATAKLEELMNQVGELLIAQAMVQHNPELQPNSHLAQAVGRQGRILRNLQVLSLSLRMVPLRGTFQKMARVVYDTAKKLGKQVEFTLGGEDTEIDRTLAETMSDPLMHMVRNGIDHGIEMPDVRVKNGKPAIGKLRLEAFQAGDDVVIRLIDDGGGMDPQKLRAKAIEKGLIDPNQVMDEQACFQIIFLPGFSTAAKVTDVSGRGVGMDVVRRQVEEADGTVHIASVIGKGTTFTIRLPMTTAILDAMQLKVGTENLLMPINSIIEMLRPKTGQVQTILDRGQLIKHRDRMLPLVNLGNTLGISGSEQDPEQAILVVIENHGSDFVIQVDAILGQRQVVIKPFDEGVVHHPGTSGTTILGDGRVALILNPAFLVQSQAETLTI
jgi:two-component system, chemotaxis family, sensor kinase CheA